MEIERPPNKRRVHVSFDPLPSFHRQIKLRLMSKRGVVTSSSRCVLKN